MTGARDEPVLLRLTHTLGDVVDTLGPGSRSVVWVQGCSIHCPGCIVPETWGTQTGTWVDPVELAARLLDGTTNDLTVSGGEPTEQPAAVALLLREAHRRGRTTWVYSGRRLEDLVEDADDDMLAMLSQVDVLVDGPYERATAGGVGYRGSRNQRIIHLTDAIPREAAAAGRPGKIEVRLDGDDGLVVVGIPEPGTLPKLQAALADRGVQLDAHVWR